MRKRLNGVYRADSGFSGPTRRYVLIVALLVGLASVPTLAAITAGTNELADGTTDTMDIPFLPPASPGPVGGSTGLPGSGSSRTGHGPASGSIGDRPDVSPSSSGSPAGPGPADQSAIGASPSSGPSSGPSGNAAGPAEPARDVRPGAVGSEPGGEAARRA